MKGLECHLRKFDLYPEGHWEQRSRGVMGCDRRGPDGDKEPREEAQLLGEGWEGEDKGSCSLGLP